MTPKKFAATISPRLIGDEKRKKFIKKFADFYEVSASDKRLWLSDMGKFFNDILPTLLAEERVNYEEIDDIVCGLYKEEGGTPVILEPLRKALKDKRLYYNTGEDCQPLALVDGIMSANFKTADAMFSNVKLIGYVWTINGVIQMPICIGELRVLAEENVYDPRTEMHLFYSDLYYYDYLSSSQDENYDEEEVLSGEVRENFEKAWWVEKILRKVFIFAGTEICEKYTEEIMSQIDGTITPSKVYEKVSEFIGKKLI